MRHVPVPRDLVLPRESSAELACLRQGFRLGELVFEAIPNVVNPVMAGPCTGFGLMRSSNPGSGRIGDCIMEPSMTFQTGAFFYDEDYRRRWEHGMLVTPSGAAEMLNGGAHLESIGLNR